MLLVGKMEGKRPLGRHRWWMDNIKMNVGEIRFTGLIGPEMRTLEGSCEHSNKLSSSIKGSS
jgi:hypothetical protein